MNKDELNWREQFLVGALGYVRALRAISIVESITLFGSLTTEKPDPKDVDLLIVLVETIKLRRLEKGALDGSKAAFDELVFLNKAARAEKYKQRQRQIADLFVATSQYEYIGDLSLDYDKDPLKRYYEPMNLPEVLSKSFPIKLWPEIELSTKTPQDVLQCLVRPLR